jgi:hypothetical protein
MKVKNVEYFLGKPIKERPIKIEFLRVCPDDQIIAGRINFLAKREYEKKPKPGEEKPETPEMKPYFTFVLDDGENKQQCVYFPTQNSLSKIDKLIDGIVVTAIGTNTERNGRVSFRVMGLSLCEFA